MPNRAVIDLKLTDQEIDRIAARVSETLKGHLGQRSSTSGEQKPNKRRLLTVKQAANKLGLSRDAFYRLRKEGLFTEYTLPIGGLRFDEAEIDRVIDELKEPTA